MLLSQGILETLMYQLNFTWFQTNRIFPSVLTGDLTSLLPVITQFADPELDGLVELGFLTNLETGQVYTTEDEIGTLLMDHMETVFKIDIDAELEAAEGRVATPRH